ncbi:Hypothetical protein ACA1_275170, partial [Acanthamoeba castellanii str. Neff]
GRGVEADQGLARRLRQQGQPAGRQRVRPDLPRHGLPRQLLPRETAHRRSPLL